jgi:UDP-N-acetyl-D-glucosamine dehydrogenase
MRREMVTLFKNTFLSFNIGMVNELLLMSDVLGVDVYEVIDAAATKPFGFIPSYPGPGLGGYCIPIDPHYLCLEAQGAEFSGSIYRSGGRNQRHDAFSCHKYGR